MNINKEGNNYTFGFAIAMVVVVGTLKGRPGRIDDEGSQAKEDQERGQPPSVRA